MSLGPVCAIVSMRSTTSSGVGTQITSLPAWPTCGSNFWAEAANGRASAASKKKARTRGVMAFAVREMRARECSRKARDGGETDLSAGLLQHFGGVVREARALAARERYVPGVRPVFHAIDDVGKARAAFGEVGCVDLRHVAKAYHLRAG